jgi:hypothetical protein
MVERLCSIFLDKTIPAVSLIDFLQIILKNLSFVVARAGKVEEFSLYGPLLLTTASLVRQGKEIRSVCENLSPDRPAHL